MRAIAIPHRQKRLIAGWPLTGWLQIGWLLMLWITAGWFAANSARADIYSWEDSQGIIHYSNQDAPPEAALYMRETAPPENTEHAEIIDDNNSEKVAREAARQQALARENLEEVNHKLSRALDKVDDLTASVARSKAQAEAAAEAARQAEREVAAAGSDRSDVQERVIVHTVPYRSYRPHHRYRHENYGNNHLKHKATRQHSRRLTHEKRFRPQTSRVHSKIEKIRRQRHKPEKYQIPGPILPPEPYRIPAAYGIR
jgi:hypothetical protein